MNLSPTDYNIYSWKCYTPCYQIGSFKASFNRCWHVMFSCCSVHLLDLFRFLQTQIYTVFLSLSALFAKFSTFNRFSYPSATLALSTTIFDTTLPFSLMASGWSSHKGLKPANHVSPLITHVLSESHYELSVREKWKVWVVLRFTPQLSKFDFDLNPNSSTLFVARFTTFSPYFMNVNWLLTDLKLRIFLGTTLAFENYLVKCWTPPSKNSQDSSYLNLSNSHLSAYW